MVNLNFMSEIKKKKLDNLVWLMTLTEYAFMNVQILPFSGSGKSLSSSEGINMLLVGMLLAALHPSSPI